MITKAELEKIVEDGAEYYATNEGATIEKREAFTVDKHLGNPQQYEYVNRYNNDSFCAFKSGASFVTGILMPEIEKLEKEIDRVIDVADGNSRACIIAVEENFKAKAEIERVENNCDTLENKAIFWMETNDRAIEHTESLQLTITTLKTEIQSLKDENGRLNKFLLRIQVRIDETNRHEDDLDMISDLVAQALTHKAEELDKCPPHSWDASGERCTKCGDKDWMT